MPQELPSVRGDVELDEARVECAMCREPVRKSALKCPHCHANLSLLVGIRRHQEAASRPFTAVQKAAVVVALLLALLFVVWASTVRP